MTPELTKERIDELVASDANLIGLHLAARYASGAGGICLARDIRDVVMALKQKLRAPPSAGG